MNKPLIIDIYHGDSVVDLQKTKAAGIIGVIHKATQGKTICDPKYDVRRKQAAIAGMLWGAYHFFHGQGSTADAVAEADFFLGYVDSTPDTLLALDWENVGGGSATATQARAFLDRIQDRLQRKAVIYSGNVAKERIRGKDDYFGAHRLWLCQYGKTWKTQASWPYPWLWQNNGDASGPGPHTISGINGYCDNNTIVDPMTEDRLRSEWSS